MTRPKSNVLCYVCVLLCKPKTTCSVAIHILLFLFPEINGHGHHHHRHGRRSHPSTSLTSSLFGFGMPGLDDIFAHANSNGNTFTSFSTFNSSLAGPGSANMRSTTTTTRVVNGKKITTKK